MPFFPSFAIYLCPIEAIEMQSFKEITSLREQLKKLNIKMFNNLLITHLGRLRLTAFIEGWSFLILLFIAMPLKYLAGIPQAVRVVGMAHGVLFILYILFVLIVTIQKKWSFKVLFLLFLASLVPFATFYADKIFLKKQA